jgi:hypothetical protein
VRKFLFDKTANDRANLQGAEPAKTPSMQDSLMGPGAGRKVTQSPQAQAEEAMRAQVQEQGGDIGQPQPSADGDTTSQGNPVLDDANAMAQGIPLPSESPDGFQANMEAQGAQAEAAAAAQEGAAPSAGLMPPPAAGAGGQRKTIIEKKTIIEPAMAPQTAETMSTGPAGPAAGAPPSAGLAPPPTAVASPGAGNMELGKQASAALNRLTARTLRS